MDDSDPKTLRDARNLVRLARRQVDDQGSFRLCLLLDMLLIEMEKDLAPAAGHEPQAEQRTRRRG